MRELMSIDETPTFKDYVVRGRSDVIPEQVSSRVYWKVGHIAKLDGGNYIQAFGWLCVLTIYSQHANITSESVFIRISEN